MNSLSPSIARVLLAALLLAPSGPVRADDPLPEAFQAAREAAAQFEPAAPAGSPDSGRAVEIVLFHTNDIHGYIGPQKADPKRGWPETGGAASLATLIRGESRPKLWFDAGDWYQGTPEGTMSRGDAVVEVFNAVGLDAAVLGNHEYDHGEANVQRMLAGKARFKVLGTNITQAGGRPPPYAGATALFEPAPGVKIGVFGLLTSDMPSLVSDKKTAGLSFGGEVAAARAAVAALRAQGAAIIVAVTHLGVEAGVGKRHNLPTSDEALARQVPGIDVILGGHTHTQLDKPVVVAGAGGGRTVITQTSGQLRSVYRLVLSADAASGRLLKVDAAPVVLSVADYPADPAVAAIVAASRKLVEQKMDEPIGSASAELRRGSGESVLGNWMTDAMRRAAGTDAAAMNTHGIRADLPAGPLAYKDLFQVAPFDDNLVEVRLAGAQLRKAAEASLTSSGLSLQWSGLRIVADHAAAAGSRLVSLTLADGSAVDDARVYSVLTVEFVATVGEVFKPLQKTVSPPQELILRDLLEKEIRANSPIGASLDGRVTAR